MTELAIKHAGLNNINSLVLKESFEVGVLLLDTWGDS